MERNATNSLFLRLPYEIRLMCYEYTLCGGETFRILRHERSITYVEEGSIYQESVNGNKNRSKLYLFQGITSTECALVLLGVCRQTYIEAAPVFWRVNTFWAALILQLHQWLYFRSRFQRQMIPNLRFCVCCCTLEYYLDILEVTPKDQEHFRFNGVTFNGVTNLK